MHSFDYLCPSSLEELCEVRAAYGHSSSLLAGGTDLLVQMRNALRRPERVIDVKAVPELNVVERNRSELNIGAAVSCRKLYLSAQVGERWPALAESARLVGSVQNQGRATIGGNLCNAAPSADLIPPLIVYSAEAALLSSRGKRQLSVETLCTGPGQTVLSEDELLADLRLPEPGPRSGAGYLRFTPRNEMDIAVAGVAVHVSLREDLQTIAELKVALSAVAPRVLAVEGIAEELAGERVSDELLYRTADLAATASDPIDDMRGSASQRRHLVRVLTTRVFTIALERAREQSS